MKRGFLFFLFLLMAGCGFHLRGQTALPPQLKHIAVVSQDQNSAFKNELVNTLRHLDLNVETIEHRAPYTLHILSEYLSQAASAVSASTQTRQYTLYYTVNFELTDQKGKVIIPQSALSTSRVLTLNMNQILSSNSEALTLQKEMQQEIMMKLMNRLTARRTRNLLI